MPDEVTILDLEDRIQWMAAVGEGPPSQSWDYAWGLAASGFRPRLAVVDSASSRLVIPFYEREWQGHLDVATLPGLSGASAHGPDCAPAFARWRSYAERRGWVAGYLQLGIFTPIEGAAELGELATHNSVFVFDLERWDARLSVSRNFRVDKLSEGKRRGATLETDPERLDAALRRLYPAAMRRHGNSNAFSLESLRRWMFAGDAFALGAVVAGEVEAVHLGRRSGLQVDWDIAATSERGRGLGAWLIGCAIERLKGQGARWLNIGGGKHIGDGVYAYKRRFNATEMPLRSLRQIYDEPRYARLCGGEVAGSSATTWFPAYRARALRQAESGYVS